jgi:hypothetical protein
MPGSSPDTWYIRHNQKFLTLKFVIIYCNASWQGCSAEYPAGLAVYEGLWFGQIALGDRRHEEIPEYRDAFGVS